MYSVNIRWKWDQKKNTLEKKYQPWISQEKPLETIRRARAPTLLLTHQRGARSPAHEIIMRSGLFLAGSPCRGAAVNNASPSRRRSLFNRALPLPHLCSPSPLLWCSTFSDGWLHPWPLAFPLSTPFYPITENQFPPAFPCQPLRLGLSARVVCCFPSYRTLWLCPLSVSITSQRPDLLFRLSPLLTPTPFPFEIFTSLP